MLSAIRLRWCLATILFVDGRPSASPCEALFTVVESAIVVPQDDGLPLPGRVWYPVSRASRTIQPQQKGALPLIVVSHGVWGDSGSQNSLVRGLAARGFVVAALSHREYKGYFLMAPERRTAQLHHLTDYMLDDWQGRSRIDPRRVGAFGFSLGGFTVLVAVGGRPDISLMASHCRDAPREWSCSMEQGKHLDFREHPPPVSVWVADRRIKAVVALAPAMGYLFGKHGLEDVRIPVQLWQGDHDSALQAPYNAEIVQSELPRPADYHRVAGDHADLLRDCPDNADGQPQCGGIQASFQRQVADFFQRNLH